jgi:hypothetical protein
VFVVRGAAKHERRIYKFWEEPAPNVVLEISSRKTRKEDLGKKKDLYAWLGVREYTARGHNLSISQLFHKSVKFNVFSSLPPSSIVQFVPARSIFCL